MMHITEEYGQPCNLLVLSEEEYRVLDAFLRLEGVRIRQCKSYRGTVTIQGENPFQQWLTHCARTEYPAMKGLERAREEMSDREIERYKW